MQLKSLQIQGFKSFPDRTELVFGKGMTAVVGPNGSGKSNISDAVRWVLGEQSTRNLRGEKMEDVIFLGTHNRKPTGFASVSLTIDNTDRQLAVDSDDVTITRKLYRSGESEYRINKTAVRLRDITELLMDTGLGRDGYSIIGQGRIEEIVSVKSSQRREIFEEAAGISKYRYRKAEAEKKLESAYENLLRLKDIIGELQDRVEPLREQAERAKRFLQLSEEKKTLEVSLWTHLIEKSRALLEQQEQEYLLAKNNCADVNAVLEEFQHRIEDGFAQVQAYILAIEQSQRQIALMKSERSGCDSDLAVAKNDQQHNERSLQETNEEILSNTAHKDETKGQLRELRQELEKKQALLDKAQADSAQAQQETQSIDEELSGLHTRIAQLKGKRTAFEQDITRQKLNRVSSSALIEETSQRLQTLQGSQNERDDGIAALRQELASCQELLDKIEEHRQELENTAAGYTLKLQRQQKVLQGMEEEVRLLRTESDQLEHRARVLSEMEKSMEGYYNSVKSVLSASGQGRLSGILGTVSQLISVGGDYALAIETVLGSSLQHIVTEDEAAAKNAIHYLKYTKAGRATFLPLDVIQPQKLLADGIEQMEGFVAQASRLVSCEPRYRSIVENLLGRVVVAQDIDAAVQIAKRYSYRFRVVTLDGQLVNAGGSLTGGSAAKSAGLLSRREEIETLRGRIESLGCRMQAKDPEMQQTRQNIVQLQAQLLAVQAEQKTCQEDKITYTSEHKRLTLSYEEACRARDEMEKEYTRIHQKLEQLRVSSDSADSLIEQVSGELEQLGQELEQAKQTQEHLLAAKTALAEQQNVLRYEILGLEKDLESGTENRIRLETAVQQQDDHVQALVDKLNTLQNVGRQLERKIEQLKQRQQELDESIVQENKKIDEAIEQRNHAEQQLSLLRNEEKEHIAHRERAAAQMARCEERRTVLQTEYDKMIARLWDEYNMTRSDALAAAVEIEDEPRAQGHLSELKNKIRALGSVNVSAIEEYQEVSERYEFLTRQAGDVERSRTELMNLIRELTSQMRQMFSESFAKINENFKQIFTELFLGGQAELVLTDPDHVLESGIEIKVQPPGKIIKNLSALSGGEKAFVAIAIYFAILKVKPSPFCMLDEIEAALDEVNVTRYARYLKSLSDQTQFIAITHRRGTMEEADVMYGVTMQEKGVSRLLELDISQVESRLGMKG